ncbi:MAG: CpsD/CapB family tyrosine-protein kinase, partial [Clostridiales bacterium]|nr:CpsD/CapB family tyrosine-protein kinase [Clostridiales bacterium]
IRLNILIKPVYPEEPYTTGNIGVFTAEFAAIGALLGLVIVGIYAFFRNTVRVKDDFKNKLNQKCLVEIPRVVFHRKSHTSENEFILITGKHPMFKESFRLLRKRLLKHMDEAGDKILAVTSAAPDEGKTTVALNTAYAISMNGKKTAIVDLDFNKRLLQNKKIEVKSEEDNSDSDDKSNSSEGSFELFMSVRESINTTQKDDSQSSEENSADQREKRRKNEDDTQVYEKGVTDIISEDSPDYRSICHNVDSNLDAYYTGSQEFVFSDSAYRKFFDYLSENYDYVIVNASPCKNASEAVFVCNMCDDIMFVAKQDSVSVNKIRKSIEYLSFSKAKILGFVFNSVQEGFSGYGGYYYGGKYGYGKYGYGKYGYGRYGYGRRSYGYGGYGRDSEYGYGYGYGYGEYGYGEYGYGYGDEPHRKKSKSKKHKSDEGSDITDFEIPDNNI